MDLFSWVAQEQELSNAALTVRAQAVSPDDQGQLLWNVFYRSQDVDSVRLDTISDVRFRPAADRRDWNQRGRQITLRTPEIGALEMIPIESYFKIEEREMQALLERGQGDQGLFRRLIRASYPQRVEDLAAANFRRMEIDAFTAWSLGTVTVMNPQTGTTYTVSYGFDSARYQTAGTVWSAVGQNAYNNFLDWVEDGRDAMGSAGGVVLRRASFKEIQADAPQGVNAVPLTAAQLRDRVQQDLGFEFAFYILENTVDKYTDGGIVTAETKIWPLDRLALLPAGSPVIGEMRFAPVGRAYSIVNANPNAQINVRGNSVFREIAGNGRELTTECQINSFPVPIESRLWVIDAF